MKKYLVVFGAILMANSMISSVLAQSTPTSSVVPFSESQLHYKTGTQTFVSGAASFDSGTQYRFLEAADAQKLLEEGWGNPHDPDVLGLIVPANLSPMAKEGWAVAVTYDSNGHVSDSDASSINYTEMLQTLKDDSTENNAARKKAGYPEIELVGWAVPPRYDGLNHKLYWAKEISFDKDPAHTLNYAVRVLGRKGVLELNAVASMNQLPLVQRDMETILAATHFNTGQTYADFNPSSDKLAEYGIAALVAGGVAAKLGFFAKIGIFLLGLKKFGLVLLLGIGALFRRFFGRKQQS
jgi:uncharacterized membrane-anchored protein